MLYGHERPAPRRAGGGRTQVGKPVFLASRQDVWRLFPHPLSLGILVNKSKYNVAFQGGGQPGRPPRHAAGAGGLLPAAHVAGRVGVAGGALRAPH